MVNHPNRSKKEIRPVEHLKAAGQHYPRAWKLIDVFREGRGKDLPKWPAWCFLPMSAWYAIVSEDSGGIAVPLNQVQDIGRLGALGTWRYSQGIYRFDQTIFDQLWNTGISGDLPGDVLLRLPEWCIYIETPGKKYLDDVLYGFFVHLEWDATDHRHELRLLLDMENYLLPQPIHIGDWPLSKAIERMINESTRHIPTGTMIPLPNQDQYQAWQNILAPIMNLILYLCSDEPDFGPSKRPERAKTKRTKKGWKLFPAQKPIVWNIGERIGKQIREYDATQNPESTVRTVRPHLRRAHWHGYWTGPKDGPQRFKYHWIPPLLVGENNDR